MKKITSLALCTAVLAGMAGCSSAQNSTETTDSENNADRTRLVVGFDAEFPPYGYKEGDEFVGFDLDLAQAVADSYGWELVKQPIDWESKDMELESNSIDCIWNGFTMNGREDAYTWTSPYIDNSQVIVVKSDSGIDSIEDLAGKTIDVQADSSALAAISGDDATDAGKKIAETAGSLTQVPNYNTAFMDLEAGACDAIAMDIGVANYELANRSGDFKILDEEISTEQYAVGFKKGNEELRDQVESALKEMQSNGKIDEILKTWTEKDGGSYSFLETTWCFGKE